MKVQFYYLYLISLTFGVFSCTAGKHPPNAAQALSDNSADAEEVIGVSAVESGVALPQWPMPTWKKARRVSANGISYLEIYNEGDWTPVVQIKDVFEPPKRDASFGDAAGWHVENDPTLALLLLDESIAFLKREKGAIKTATHRLNPVPIIEKLPPVAALTLSQDETASPKNRRRQKEIAYFKSATMRARVRLVLKLGGIALYKGKGGAFWRHDTVLAPEIETMTNWTGNAFVCATISVNVYEHEVDEETETLVSVVERQPKCKGVVEGSERVAGRIYSINKSGEVTLLFSRERYSVEAHEDIGRSKTIRHIDESYFPTRFGRFIQRREYYQETSDWPEARLNDQKNGCSKGELAYRRTIGARSLRRTDWFFAPKASHRIKLHRIDHVPPEDNKTHELFCLHHP